MLAEILNFQGTNPILGMGSFSYLNKLLKIWNSNALQKIDEMRWVVEKLDGILMNIKAKEIEDHMDELEEE